MGITAGKQQQLQVLDSTKTWVPIGAVSSGIFTVYGAAGVDVRAAGCKANGSSERTFCINNAIANAPAAGSDSSGTANGFYRQLIVVDGKVFGR